MSDDAIQCIKCTFRGCRARTFQPYTDGWANLSAWGPAFQTAGIAGRTPTPSSAYAGSMIPRIKGGACDV
jgi:hypothetical protein